MENISDFMIRFIFCNLFICMIVCVLLAAKRSLRNQLTSRAQYRLWFVLFGLLAVPFLPAVPDKPPHLLSWLACWKDIAAPRTETITGQPAVFHQPAAADWMNDLSVAVTQRTPSAIGLILFALWVTGILVMLIFFIRSTVRLHTWKKSALPLQNREIRSIYHCCLAEMNLTKGIPVYSTAFLKSPVLVGLFRPCIYLPLHLVSDHNAADVRYMLLHELQHYKHKDALVNCLMHLAGIVYWCNPFVWYALKEMRCDREIACDTSVLKILGEDFYQDYGNTLINFAEKISFAPFPFVFGMGGSMAQMKKRILSIAAYRPATPGRTLRSILSCALIVILLCGFIPVLSIQASDKERYYFQEEIHKVSYPDLSSYFGEYDGSFVLYDTAEDSWQIYNPDNAVTRIAPASTYKIYIALSGLQSGIITQEHSQLTWDGQDSPFDAWNADQTLKSAMQNSVNWYFQEIDRQIGFASIKNYIHEIGYGSQTVSGDASSYWMNSSLKISPIEQVEMLEKLYHNKFGFSPEAVEAVKDSLCLFSTADGSLYGKTGTISMDGQDVSGWFIGFVEKEGRPCFFAANIQGEDDASGAAAAELSLAVLSGAGVWK